MLIWSRSTRQNDGQRAEEKCPHLLRRVVVWDEANNRIISLLTNHLKFGATTISDIYKDRWEIEIFFKNLKQHLKVKTFIGTSENALRIQIWTSMSQIISCLSETFAEEIILAGAALDFVGHDAG